MGTTNHKWWRALTSTPAGAVACLALGCGGGQSGNEGELPAPPCAAPTAILIQGHVASLGGGCVALEVDAVLGGEPSVVASDGAILLDADLTAGDVIQGRLGRVYSYAHHLSVADQVVVLASSWSDTLSFEVMPFAGGNIRIQWAGREFDATPADLLAADCADRVQRLRESGTDIATGGSDTRAVELGAEQPSCSVP